MMLRRRPDSSLSRRSSAKGPLGALPALSAVARRALAWVALLSLAGAGLLVAQAFLLADALASLVDGRVAGVTLALQLLAGVVVGRALVSWATRVVSARAAVGVKEELRARLVDQALREGPEWVAERGPGELTSLATRGLDALDAYFTEYLPALIAACVVPPVVGLAILLADWPSAIIVAVTVPLLPMFAILVGLHTSDRVRGSLESLQRMSGHLLELVRALPVLTAFGRARVQREAVRRSSERHRTATLATLKIASSSALTLELIATLSVALVAVVIGVRLVSGDLALSVALAVLILAPECYQPLRAVGAAFHASEDGVAALRQTESHVRECAAGLEPSSALTSCAVSVRGLRVARRDGFAPDGVSFDARPGEITWLRTPSGSGKSTLLGVLLGFVRPTAGTVTVGGTALENADLSTWRRAVAWVPQFPALTEPTVRAELAAGLEDLEVAPTEADLAAVTRPLGIGELLDRDPARLSTGQRQRVAVARALLRHRHGARVLLLDEPTAHLDEAAAGLVMAAVHAAADAGATVILAAHSPSQVSPESVAEAARAEAETLLSEEDQRGNPLPLRELLDRRLIAGAALGTLGLLSGVALAATSGWLIAKASQQPPILTLTVAIVGVRLFGLARATLRYLERLATHDAAFRAATRLRVRLWDALVRLGPVRASAWGRGEGQRRLVDDVDTVRDLMPRVLTPPLVVASVAAGAVLAVTLLLPAAGVVLAASIGVGGVLALGIAFHVERHSAVALAEGRRAVRARTLTLFDALGELLAFGGARRYRADLAAADARLSATGRREAWAGGLAGALIVLATGGAAVGCTWVVADAVAAGTLDPVLAPLFALVPLALGEVLAQLPPVAAHADPLRRARVRLAAVLADAERAPEPVAQAPASADVVLDGVTVRWPGADQPVLRGAELTVPAGQWLAVTGPSGAGKSTLLATLLGFLTPDEGSVVRPHDVVWGPQEPQLVATTLAENLRLGDPAATDEDLADVLRAVCLDEFADRTDLVLGSAGAGLSGGQAGRVSLARALLAARRLPGALVVLDEPTAHLDRPTAEAVLASLRTRLAGHTVVQVTHHAADAALADHVLALAPPTSYGKEVVGATSITHEVLASAAGGRA